MMVAVESASASPATPGARGVVKLLPSARENRLRRVSFTRRPQIREDTRSRLA